MECRSRIVYERKQDNKVFYVLPVEYILGKLPLVPVGDTGTFPYSMRQHAEDFVRAAFDLNTSKYVAAARVEDGDEPPWTQYSATSGRSVVLRADRFHRRALWNSKPKEECKGIKVNIWNRAKVRRYYLDEIRCF
jgi:hypothetical protein